MANNLIQVKRTSVSGRAANTTTLPNPGELALNMTDGILYSTNGSVVFEIGANNTNATITNTLTAGNGVFSGNVSISGNLVVNGGIVSLTGNVISFTDNMLYLNQGVEAAITNITSNGTHVVFTADNNYSPGWDVFVSGVNPSSYNGTYEDIIAANSTTFTVADTNTDSYVSGGTARGKTDQNPDLGIAAGYNDGTYHHTGIFRDASDGKWKVFDNYGPEPDASPYIDTANSTFHLADFQANALYLGNTSTDWLVANTSELFHSGAVNAATVLVRGGATVNGTLTVNAVSANGGVGSAGEALFSDGTKAYWNVVTAGAVDQSARYNWTNTHTFQDTVTFGNTSVNSTVNSTFFTGTANNTSFIGSVSAANVVSNSQLFGNLANYQTTTGLASNVATLTSNNSTYAYGKTEGNLNVNSALFANSSEYANTSNYANASFTNTFTVGTGTYFVSNGNVGIGTNTPVAALQVESTTVNVLALFNDNTSPSGGGAGIQFGQRANAAMTANARLGFIVFNGTYDTSLTTFNAAGVTSFAEELWSPIARGASIRFETTSLGSTTRTEKMRIDADGNVGIGNIAPDARLTVTGTANVSGNMTIGGVTTLSANVVLGSSGLSANGGFGSAGQVLHSNGTATYWAADDQGVTSVASGNGITGGTITSTGTLSIVAGTGLVVNSTGIHVNSDYIDTLGADTLGGVPAANYVQNTDSRILSGNLNFTGANNVFTTRLVVNATTINATGVYTGNVVGNVVATTISGNLTGNVAAVTITGNLTGNVVATTVNATTINATANIVVGSAMLINTTAIQVGNSTVRTIINTTAFSGNVVATTLSGNLTGNVVATTISGNLTGNVAATTISGNLTAVTADVTNKLQVGTAVGFDFGSNAVIEVEATGNTYVQVVLQNANTGNNASADLVVTNDTGNDSFNYVDLGINGSNYNQAGYGIVGQNDAYLYASDGNLAIGTKSAKEVIFHAGGTTTSDRKLTINSTAVVIANSSALVANASKGTAGQVLHSNGTGVYWAADDQGVTSVASGNGITGGTITTTGTLSVVAGTGVVVNATGVHVNATYINTISANAATYLGAAGNFGNATGIYTSGLVNAATVNATTLLVGANFTANATQVTASDLLVTGNLVVNGTMVTLNTATLDVRDLNITLAKGTASAAAANGAGITVDGANATLTYINASNTWLSNINFAVGNSTSNVSINATSFVGNVVATTVTGNLSGTAANATLLNNKTEGNLNVNSALYANASVTNTFTVGTGTYFVSNGNVGVGNTTPSAKLTVGSPNASAVSFVNSAVASFGGGIAFDPGVGVNLDLINYRTTSMVFGNGGTEKVRIDASGNVGIGNTSPAHMLSVNGNAYLSGDLTVAGGQIYTSTESTRNKIHLYGADTAYAIGMQSAVTYGGLGDWAMTFQFNATANRGFWWGHNGHTVAQGAMALTNDGKLTVAKSLRLGFGESDSTDPGTNYTLEVNGSFAATTKSFVIDHPTKPDMKLRYGSLEGPENGVYVRGRSKTNTIELPDYWTGLVDEDSITVNLTPIGKKQDLYVKSIQDNVVTVAGCKNFDYFFTVFAERKDVEKLVVEF